MKKDSYKVPVQKGNINPDMKTIKTMLHKERLVERAQELKDLKDGQTLKMHVPKK